MKDASELPTHLVDHYRHWKEMEFAPNRQKFEDLVEFGQKPKTMMISCCDSRVNALQIFEAEAGDMFVHRNVAALVPPYEVGNHHQATSAALEYAVTVLKVERIIVLGHSKCGGVQGCYDMCEGNAPPLLEGDSFVGRWIDVLRPGYERLPDGVDPQERVSRLEKEAVLVSLENLLTFPWIASRVEGKELDVIGLWSDIATGSIECWSPQNGAFVAV